MTGMTSWIMWAALSVGVCVAPCGLAVGQPAEASVAIDKNAPDKPWTPVTHIDFSSTHNIMIRNYGGSFTPMDEPHFVSTKIAPGTWQILDDGDHFYLVEGDREALLIDGGYGASNPRAYAQSLTSKPLRYIANTHSHFDHVANDGYFDRAYMSQKTKDELPKPSGSFATIPFPMDYPIQVVSDGYKFDLGNRTIEVILLGNHTPGSTAYLDRKARILYSGDEIMGKQGIGIRVTVEQWKKLLEKLAAHRSEFDTLCAGWEMMDASWIDKYLAVANYILAGNNGPPASQVPRAPLPNDWPATTPQGDPQGRITFVRHVPRGNQTTVQTGPDGLPLAFMSTPSRAPTNDNIRRMTYGGVTVTYDITKVRDQP